MRRMIPTNQLQELENTDLSNIKSIEHIKPEESKLVIDEDLQLGDSSLTKSPMLKFVSEDLTNQGNWGIYTDGQTKLTIQQIGQGDVLCLARDQLYPNSPGYTTLGNGSKPFKTVYLSHYVMWPNNTYFQKNSAHKIESYSNGTLVERLGAGAIEANVNVIPTGEGRDLGSSSNAWQDLYIARNVYLKGLPTSDPQVEGQLWNDNGVLKISAGE